MLKFFGPPVSQRSQAPSDPTEWGKGKMTHLWKAQRAGRLLKTRSTTEEVNRSSCRIASMYPCKGWEVSFEKTYSCFDGTTTWQLGCHITLVSFSPEIREASVKSLSQTFELHPRTLKNLILTLMENEKGSLVRVGKAWFHKAWRFRQKNCSQTGRERSDRCVAAENCQIYKAGLCCPACSKRGRMTNKSTTKAHCLPGWAVRPEEEDLHYRINTWDLCACKPGPDFRTQLIIIHFEATFHSN